MLDLDFEAGAGLAVRAWSAEDATRLSLMSWTVYSLKLGSALGMYVDAQKVVKREKKKRKEKKEKKTSNVGNGHKNQTALDTTPIDFGTRVKWLRKTQHASLSYRCNVVDVSAGQAIRLSKQSRPS